MKPLIEILLLVQMWLSGIVVGLGLALYLRG